jgi:uncharacterized protein YjbJ (UPF0337 family)
MGDKIDGLAKQAKGTVKEMAGKVTNDPALEAEGKADKVAGKVQETVGDAKNAAKDALRR